MRGGLSAVRGLVSGRALWLELCAVCERGLAGGVTGLRRRLGRGEADTIEVVQWCGLAAMALLGGGCGPRGSSGGRCWRCR